jgi:hypothetical protein
VGYGLVPATDHRNAPFVLLADETQTGDLSSKELSALQSAFGKAVTVDHSAWDLIQATTLVWWRTALSYGLLAMVAVWIARRYRRNAADERDRA